jgi:hypothetical protein
MITFGDNPVADYAIAFYLTDPTGGPADDAFLSMSGPTSVMDLGSWNGTAFNLIEVTFTDLDLPLDGGQYWLSSWGIGNGTHEDRAFWGTSGFDKIAGSEGYFRSDWFGIPEWTAVSELLGDPEDFAFRIEGEIIPGPPALLALLGLTAFRGKRRR